MLQLIDFMKDYPHAIIKKENFIHNLKFLHKRANVPLCLPVKANAYGHGIIEMAKIALETENTGVVALGISRLSEGVQLRETGVKAPIFCFTPPLSLEDAITMVKLDIEPFSGNLSHFMLLEEAGKTCNKALKVHLKINTGMNRLGVSPEEAYMLACEISESLYLELRGVATHFAISDEKNSYAEETTKKQLSTFEKVVSEIQDTGIKIPYIHAANSGALLHHKKSVFNLARPGISSYGYGLSALKPVMSLKGVVIDLQELSKGDKAGYGLDFQAPSDGTLALVNVGYGDGYFRSLSNRAEALFHSQKGTALYPIAGRVCMCMTPFWLGDNPLKIEEGCEVTLWGAEENAPTASDLAQKIDTISYELLTGITQRVPRVYL